MDQKMIDAFMGKLDRTIASHGHAVQCVMDNPAFAYTIGNCRRDLPELFIAGLAPGAMQAILNDATRMMREGTRWADHVKTKDLAIGYETAFRLVDLTMVDTELNILRAYCKRRGIAVPPVYQLVWPDPEHRFPWELGFDETMRSFQPVLYAPTRH